MPRIGPCQVLAATLTLSQPGGQIMPTLYWGPWLAKIRGGGPDQDASPDDTIETIYVRNSRTVRWKFFET